MTPNPELTQGDGPQVRRIREGIHHGLVVLLIALRPLIWDGESAGYPALIWYALLGLGLALLAVEIQMGIRTQLRWGWCGIIAGALILALLPAAFRSPLAYEGWALWGQWAGHLALAGYVMQVLPGRERLAFAALAAGLTGEILYSLGQWQWGIPALMAQVESGRLVQGEMQHLMRERLFHGGLFGSFTLSNGLAGYLILGLAPLLGALWTGGGRMPRILLALIFTAGVLTLVLTRSKGALVAVAAAAGCIALWRGRGLWRALVPSILVTGGIIAWFLPSLRLGMTASAEVRWGYWQAAWALIGEHPWIGSGIGGFASQSSRVLPIGAEFSRQVHNEPLEAAVAGGVLAGVLLLILMVGTVVRIPTKTPDSDDVPLWPCLTPLFVIPYLHVFGLLPLGDWPGATGNLNLIAALVLGGAMAITGLAARALPAPPGWSLLVGVGALILHACVDFDLHAGGVVGTWVVISCLAASSLPARSRLITWRWPAILAVGGYLAVLGWGSWRGRTIVEASDLAIGVEALPRIASTRPDIFPDLLAEYRDRLGLPPPSARDASPAALRDLAGLAIDQAWPVLRSSPSAAPNVLLSLLVSLPPGRERLPRSTDLVASFPASARFRLAQAEDFAALGLWHECLAAARSGVTHAPWNLPNRKQLADWLEKAAAAGGDPALLEEAVQERNRITELADRVHWQDRLPSGDL